MAAKKLKSIPVKKPEVLEGFQTVGMPLFPYNKQLMEVNVRSVYGMRRIGVGRKGLQKL